MDRQQLIDELAHWIDTNVIAELIVESLEENHPEEEITIQQARDVWYSTIEHLGSWIGEFIGR